MSKYYARRTSANARTDEDAAMSTVTEGPFADPEAAIEGLRTMMEVEALALIDRYPNHKDTLNIRGRAMLDAAVEGLSASGGSFDGESWVTSNGDRFLEVDGLRFSIFSVPDDVRVQTTKPSRPPVVIESAEYGDVVRQLMRDPIVGDMAVALLRDAVIEDLAHENGTPRYKFMLAAGDEYRRRGGAVEDLKIGSVARALLALLKSKSDA